MLRIHLVVLVSVFSTAAAIAGPAPIVGGTRATSKDWPDVVGVLGEGGVCTGTLIAPDVVLTAGHCIGIAPHTIVTHADDLFDGSPGERIPVKWSRAYPDWEHRYDVGVVVLQRVARVAPRAIASACLANRLLADGAPVRIAGYGLATEDASDNGMQLRAATAAVTDPFCTSAPGCLETARPKGELAAGGRGTDSCFGDSGGPAYLDTASGRALVGVVSRGLDVPGQPCGNGGIYVRADKVAAWIESVTDRDLARISCAGPSDDAVERAPDDELAASDGCAAGSGAGVGALAALLGLAFVARTGRRRRAA